MFHTEGYGVVRPRATGDSVLLVRDPSYVEVNADHPCNVRSSALTGHIPVRFTMFCPLSRGTMSE
jgi:hypothetical protein